MKRALMAGLVVVLAAGLMGCAPEKPQATAPAKAPPAAKSVEAAKPAVPPTEPAAPAAKPAEEAKPVEAAKPTEEAKPVEAAKPAEAVALPIRINCGSDKEYTDPTGAKWAADQVLEVGAAWGAVEGKTIRRDLKAIEGTQAPEVYLTERYGMKAYQFALPNGKYTVRLMFAETYDGYVDAGVKHPGVQKEGERVFTVKIQGQDVAEVDPFKDGGGFAKPSVKVAKGVAVTDGKLVIEFAPKVQNAEINGIEIMAE